METQQVQVQKTKMSPSFFFLSLGLLVSLIVSVVSLLNLVFETLNKNFPDILNSTYQYGYYSYDYEGLRSALATLIIFFPIFLVVSYFWSKQYSRGVGSVDQIIRKWLIFIVVFLSAVVVTVDLVTLVRYFVSGEITTRFILKVSVALFVALLIGTYYLLLLKNKANFKKIGFLFGGVSLVLVVCAIVFGFTMMGSPAKQRMLRLDDRRIADLQSIQYQIINYWQQKEKLPETLGVLSNPLAGYSIPVDPEFENGKAYEYLVLKEKGKLTFELCATFSMPIPKGWRESSYGVYGGVTPMMETKDMAVSYPYPGGGTGESWNHEAGRTCFVRTIDPEIYPPFPKN